MADLTQHTNYTAAYSGLLDNFWLTLAIAGACLVGYEIEVHIPRRRGRDGPFKRIPVRVVHAAKRAWKRRKEGKLEGEKGGRKSTEQLVEKGVEDERVAEARAKLGSRESWEFG
jgi:hypothetical protein